MPDQAFVGVAPWIPDSPSLIRTDAQLPQALRQTLRTLMFLLLLALSLSAPNPLIVIVPHFKENVIITIL